MHFMFFFILISFFIFDLFVPVIQFLMNQINSHGILPHCHEVVFKPIKNHIVFFRQIFKRCILKSSSDTLPFCSNSIIQIWSPSKFEIHSSGSLSIKSNLLLWNLLLNLSRYDAVCRAYLLTSLSYDTSQFPSRKSSLFAFFTSPKATLPTEKLVLINKIKSSQASSLNSPSFTIFCWDLCLPLVHFCIPPA